MSESGKTVKAGKMRKARRLTALALLTAATFGVGANVATAQTGGERSLAVVAKDANKCGALLVGVDEYETLTPLEYASSDARKLRDALVEIGFPSETIRMFVSDGRIRDRPSRERILAALDEILAASGPDSTVLIALSGHGFETEKGVAAFCPEDAEVKIVDGKKIVKAETAILIEEIAERLRKDDARFKLLIVDACREPASTEKGTSAKARSFSPIPEARGVAFLQSCETEEFSWEHWELKGGVFTHFFVEGVRGAADADGDGGVSFLDVCNYTMSHTQRFVREKRDRSQTPFYRFSGVVDFWLKSPTRTSGGTAGGGGNAVAEADYRQGCELAFGLNGTKIDGRRGLELLTKAADAGSVDAQALLAELYWNGYEGIAPDAARAYGLAFEAAQSENPFALDILGDCYKEGRVVAKDEKQAAAYYARAFRGFEKRSNNGDAVATYALGLCYECGRGVAKDEAKAVELYRQASDAGYARATYALGLCYRYGRGVAKDEAKAVELYRQASDAGYAVATFALGLCYRYGRGVAKDEAKAVELYRQASDAGYAAATCDLGRCYAHGIGVAKDEAKAVELFCQASDAGYADATCDLGVCYEHGTGVAKDEAKAVELYRQASDAGYARATCYLGVCYERGTGVAKDEKKAVELYRQASDAGEAAATCNLGRCYEYGRGVAKDLDEAERLYRKAIELDPAQKEKAENALKRIGRL